MSFSSHQCRSKVLSMKYFMQKFVIYGKCHRGGNNRGMTGTRTQGLLLTVRALCQLSYHATWSIFDIFSLLN